ncbi:radical SAM protein [Cryptosporangium sp. NPDC048952]|uniref:radical SAM protein n=1 Tax=Cryptosporangium sp. NPDC048952 TaxID=3363961 RepID=UPI0037210F1E
MDSGLKRAIEQKVRAGERLTSDDGVALYDCDDLAWLGGLAHEVRTAKNGEVVFFAANRHVDTLEEALSVAPEGLTELHVLNGVQPNVAWPDYPRSLRALKDVLPDVSIKAFTAADIQWFEQISGLSADQILDELVDAGLGSLTGGGAEADWDTWSRIHRLAHSKGMKTPATMLYGSIEDPVGHVLRLRELQDETRGFQVFVPLREQDDAVMPVESLKTFAVARLLFDNVPHVKCFGGTHESSLAQLSLNFGVDDLDGYGTPDVLDLIRDAGFTPVERNARYEVVQKFEGPTPLAERRREPQPMWS